MKYSKKLICGLLILSLIFIFNTPKKQNVIVSKWETLTFIPFNGYICADLDSNVLVQMPVLIDSRFEISNEEIIRVEIPENESIYCDSINLMEGTTSKTRRIYTLSFMISSQKIQNVNVNKIRIFLENGKIITKDIGTYKFDIRSLNIAQSLEPRQFLIATGYPSTFKVSYQNVSNSKVEILGITFDNDQFNGIRRIMSSSSFDDKSLVENLVLMPQEERTFLFEYDIDEKNGKFNKNQNILPFIEYIVDGEKRTMQALAQAVVYQGEFSSDYLDTLLK